MTVIYKTYAADLARVREIFALAAQDAREIDGIDPIWIEGYDKLVSILDDVGAHVVEFCVPCQTIVLAFNRFVELRDGIAAYIARAPKRRVDMVLNILIDAQHRYLNELGRTFADFIGRPLNAIELGALRGVMLGRATSERI